MKVLFVSSGNSKSFEIAPFIKIQGESLRDFGVDVVYFPIVGKGIKGYIKASFKIRKFLRNNSFDIIHSHYTLTGFSVVIGTLGLGIPIVHSFMGSDAYGDYIGKDKITFLSRLNILLTIIIQPFVKKIISKSKNIERYVYQKRKSVIIPNGVNLELFQPDNQRNIIRDKLGLKTNTNYVLFLGSQTNIRKNFDLLVKVADLTKNKLFEICNPHPIEHKSIPEYLNACDVLVLTSFAEGSPNVIKEAMACNLPIVSTNVGDVKWLIDGVEGCYLTSFEPKDVLKKIELALEFSKRIGKTKGRKRIIELSLDSDSIAKRIIQVYKEIIEK